MSSNRGLNRHKPELLAPAGSMESLQAAINSGADAAYLGFGNSNMRRNVKNFTEQKFMEAITRLHDSGKRGYLTLNTIYFDHEADTINRTLDIAKKSEVDAVICWDPAIVGACKERGIPFHISTQASIANLQSVKFYENLGAECVVLARECTLKDLVHIRKHSDIRIESFIHGAMCIAVSGRCFMSQYSEGRSANRGDCLQPCRFPYKVKAEQHPIEVELQGSTVMSPKDLCTMPILDSLLRAGVDVLKIEGRARGADYVATTVGAYREAIDAWMEDRFDQKMQQRLTEKLQTVFNREFSTGFFMGAPIDAWSRPGNFATKHKYSIGKVIRTYPKISVIELDLQAEGIEVGEELLIIGEDCGTKFFTPNDIQMNHNSYQKAKKGDRVGVKLDSLSGVKPGDTLFKVKSIFE